MTNRLADLEVKTRNARDQDFMKCVEIIKLAWPGFAERESVYHVFCKYFSTTSFVAESDQKIVGFLLGFLSQTEGHTAYIHLVATHPKYQRKGIARRLYERFFEAARMSGRNRVNLNVSPDNLVSLEFHKSLGFHPVLTGETVIVGGVEAAKDYNGPNNHMVPFEREI
jgi:ribosomal protein S18 acetylase RimI-like enzyme